MTAGTCNGGDRGSSYARRNRKQWLVETYRADQDVLVVTMADGRRFTTTDSEGNRESALLNGATVHLAPACRCYRCGTLLSADTVSPDRIKPGCEGGTYRRDNLRPSCLPCQFVTGNQIKAKRKKAKR